MTKDDIISWAREAGWDMDGIFNDVFGFGVRIERFANLVVAAEREACAKIAEMAEPYKCADLIRARGEKV